MKWLLSDWPWYVSGPLIGLMVPLLLFIGNKPFGVSVTLKHICAAMLPFRTEYFQYDWRKSAWSLWMMGGVVIGAWVAVHFLDGNAAVPLSDAAVKMFTAWGLNDFTQLQPSELFGWSSFGSVGHWLLLGVGGFLVGFGTRYANGCTSGHAIMGLSLLKIGSLVATCGFFAGGLIVSHFVLPWVMTLVR